MSRNNYFQFKQFRVEQGQSAMKVCTDACIFGASVGGAKPPSTVLDIGAGTGLLSLMLAQRFPKAIIDAVEIDKNSYLQAKTNIEGSLWANRIKVFHTAIQDFQKRDDLYNFVICNPPFYNNTTLPFDSSKGLAHHQVSLSFGELITSIQTHLSRQGEVAILLPPKEMKDFEREILNKGFYSNKQIYIKDKKHLSVLREIVIFSYRAGFTEEQEFIIKDDQGIYTPEFKTLLKDFYLNL